VRRFPRPCEKARTALQGSTDRFLVFVERDEVLGALSYEANVRRPRNPVVVRPSHFRRAWQTALLEAFEARHAFGHAFTRPQQK